MTNSRKRTFWFGEHDRESIESKTTQGVVFSFSARIVSLATFLLSIFVLARSLSPRQFGVVGMVLVVTNLIAIVGDMGLSYSTIQRRVIDENSVSNLFWANIAIGTALSCLCFGSGFALELYYNNQRVKPIAFALSGAFLLTALSVQHSALLKRAMKFKSLAIIEISAAVLSVAVAIVMAVKGAGYWSLVGYYLTKPTVTALATWLLCRWVPNRPLGILSSKSELRFGGGIALFDVVNYLGRNLDKLLIGRVFGAATLGIYEKAYQLVIYPIAQIRAPLVAVGVPALSALVDSSDRYRRLCVSIMRANTLLAVPVIVWLVIFSDEIIAIALGSKWAAVAPLFRILGLAGLVQIHTGTLGMLLISLGKVRRYLLWGLFHSIFIAAAVIVGSFYSVTTMAGIYTAAHIFVIVPSAWYCTRDSPIGTLEFLVILVRPLAIAGAAGVGCLLLGRWVDKHAFIWGSTVYWIVYVSQMAIPKYREEVLAVAKFGFTRIKKAEE